MRDVIIYGSGGLAREVVQILEDINSLKKKWNIIGYLDDITENPGGCVNGYEVLGTHERLEAFSPGANVIIAAGAPAAREKMLGKIIRYSPRFPVVIHPTCKISKGTSIGEGTILGIDSIVSVNASLGRHVFINMRAVIAHDAKIGDFSSCLVNSIIAGNVTVGKKVIVGSNSVIMEKANIGDEARISMGAVVGSDVPALHAVMCRPSKIMNFDS